MLLQTYGRNKLDLIIALLCCLLCLWTAYRYTSMIIMALMLVILGIAWFVLPKTIIILKKNEKLFIFAFLFFFVSALLSYITGSGWELKSSRNPSMPSFTDLDLPSKYLLGALLFFLFVKLDFKIPRRIVFYAIAGGAMINGSLAIYERYIMGHGRVDGWSGIAEMADASALLGIFSLILFMFAESKKERIFYFCAIFMGCLAAILTGTRGAMLGMILTFLMIGVVIIWQRRSLLVLFLMGLVAGALSFGVGSLQASGQDALRIEIAKSDLHKYQKGQIEGNSIGARFEMWKEAVTMFQMAPFFGLSTAEIKERMQEIQQKSGSLIARGSTYNDAIGKKHNQILNQAAKRGIVGVIAILLVWFASIKLFLPYLKRSDSMMISLLGLSMIFYFIFPNSFTGEPWESNVSLPLMLILISVFWKMIWMDENRAF
ncbi:O-antigen ligase family protein [Helicobacter pametensis]|uniref:O-antigen ligase family protein n=1 Tax=Helicobacter pametensis TaxID=95149 RepID=UPI0004807809|nr:O-antigen ligase family protein [Helicobacter pametensis]